VRRTYQSVSCCDISHMWLDLTVIIENWYLHFSKQKVLDHDGMHECFYSLFVSLAGHALPSGFQSGNTTVLLEVWCGEMFELTFCIMIFLLTFTLLVIANQANIQKAAAACQVIIEYCLSRIMDYDVQQHSAISQNHLALVIKALCGELLLLEIIMNFKICFC